MKRLKSPKWKAKQRQKEEKLANIEKSAKIDAANCIPKGKSLSDLENEIHGYAESHYNENKKIAAQFFQELSNHIQELTAKITQGYLLSPLANFKNNLGQLVSKFALNIEVQKKQYFDDKDDLDQFRRHNSIVRPAHPADLLKFIIFIGIVGLLFYAEVTANGKIAGVGFAGGDAEGYIVSMVVAGLNVFVSFLIGFYAVKLLGHVSDTKKRIGKIMLFIYIPFVFYLNFSFGALRALAVKFGAPDTPESQVADDSVEGAAEGVASEQLGPMQVGEPPKSFEDLQVMSLQPWRIEEIPWDFSSFSLVAVGLAFGIFSILDGYLFDDKYPGYGSAARKVKNSRKRVLNSYKKLLSMIQKERNKTNKILKIERDKIAKDIMTWNKKTNQFESEAANFKDVMHEAQNIYDHIIKEYMLCNEKMRPNKCRDVPERFSCAHKDGERAFSYSADKINPSKIFSADWADFKNDTQRTKIRDNYLVTLKNNFNEAVAEIEKIQSEEGKKLEGKQNEFAKN